MRVVAEQFAWNVHYPGADGRFGRTDIALVSADNPLGLDRFEVRVWSGAAQTGIMRQDWTLVAGSLALELTDHRFGEPQMTLEEAKERDSNYAMPLFVTARFMNRQTGEIKEQQVFLGDFPIMTDKGVFIINGTERVIVSQLVRSPGIYFDVTSDKTSDKEIYSGKIIPGRGAWLEFDTDKKDTIGVRVDRKRRQYVSAFLKALGIAETDEEILEMFGHSESIKNTIEKDTAHTKEDALLDLYRKLRPGEPTTVESARGLIQTLFRNPKRYDLGRVGRYKISQKYRVETPADYRAEGLQLLRDDLADWLHPWEALPGGRDHFGFADGIAQPAVEGQAPI